MRNLEFNTLNRRNRVRLTLWMAGLVAIPQRENVLRDEYERFLSASPFDESR